MRVLRAPAVMAVVEGVVVKEGSRRNLEAERRSGSVGSLLCLNLAGDACAPGLATGWDQNQNQKQEQKDGGVALECSEAVMVVCLGWALARRVRLGC